MSLRRFFAHPLAIFGIIGMVIVVRMMYFHYSGGRLVIMPDSQGYYLEENFFSGRFLRNFFNPNRTPGYTMITSAVTSLTGNDYPPYNSPDFLRRLWVIIPVQMAAGIISLFFLYRILILIGISRPASLLFTFGTGINIYQFIWDQALLTESLYISLLSVLLWLFVRLLKKPKLSTAVAFTVLAGYEFLLRPAGLIIPFILLPFVWIQHRTKFTFRLMACCLLLYSLVPGSMLFMNYRLHNFRGLSFNTDFAVFGRILLYHIPVDAASSVQPLQQQVKDYWELGYNVSIPWYFFVYHNNEIYRPQELANLQRFNSLVIKSQFPRFTRTMINDIPSSFFDTEVYGVLYRAKSASFSHTFFGALDLIIQWIQRSSILFFLFVIPTAWMYIKKRTLFSAFLFAVMLLELYQLFSTLLFGGSWEFARHMITTQTYLFFFCFWWIGRIVTLIYKRFG